MARGRVPIPHLHHHDRSRARHGDRRAARVPLASERERMAIRAFGRSSRDAVRLERALARGDSRPGRRRLHPARVRAFDRKRRQREGAHPDRLQQRPLPDDRPVAMDRRQFGRCSGDELLRGGLVLREVPAQGRLHDEIARRFEASAQYQNQTARARSSMRPFNAKRAPVFAKTGMACSSQPLAATVGRDILKAGGNAADAAIAMAAVVNVTEPMMNGLGGDCMILAHWNGECLGLNGSGRSGSRLTLDNLRAAGFSTMQAGAATVPVPGALDGYLALHERFGTMDLSDLVEPAAAYAEEGFAMGAKVSHAWEWGASKLTLFSADASPYLPRGEAPKPGEIFRQKD